MWIVAAWLTMCGFKDTKDEYIPRKNYLRLWPELASGPCNLLLEPLEKWPSMLQAHPFLQEQVHGGVVYFN